MNGTVMEAAPQTPAIRGFATRAQLLALVLVALGFAAISYFWFPGHTILQSDVQVYLPILERLWDPAALAKDIMASRPHVTWTIYDEVAIALRWITGLGFEPVLLFQQFVYRAVFFLGFVLVAAACGLSRWHSVLVAAIASLGATIAGPAVLTVEYEPNPRGFALPFLALSLGLLAQARYGWAALAGGVALLFHPPTAAAYVVLFAAVLGTSRRFRALLPLAGCVAVLLLFAALQTGVTEGQDLFGRIDPALEKLQRLRGGYNYVSIWIGRWWRHYALLLAAAFLAYWRIRQATPPMLRVFFVGLPLIGVLSLPFSYLLLERAKLFVIPQFQPGRYLLFVVLFVVVLSSIAAVRAAQARRTAESVFFFLMALLPPFTPAVLDLLFPRSSSPLVWKRLALASGLALAAAVAVRLSALRPRWAPAVILLAALLPHAVIKPLGQVRNYPVLHSAELNALSQWGASSTPRDAVFVFADAGQALEPGVFRARSLRAVYVDWKAGGQVNFQRAFAREWWRRWQSVEKVQPLERYRELGIDYVVFQKQQRPAGVQPVYANQKFGVYKP
ncbi:MAG: hypothetical protein HYZ57_00390 [Acidobacteria bacterium]|nr:hypothetical protein [Acidobacteriota bacterium]